MNFKVTIRHHGRVIKHLKKINKGYVVVIFPLITWVLAHGDNNSMILRKKDNDISAKQYYANGESLHELFYDFF